MVIPAGAIELPAAGAAEPPALEYHSDNPNDDVIRNWLAATVNAEVRTRRFRAAGVDASLADRLNQPVALDNLGLVERSRVDGRRPPGAPATKAAEKVDPIRTAVVPTVLLFVMFMLIMSTTPQLLNSVIEEKMSKISEVLLGSVTPFELMMGKLLGNTRDRGGPGGASTSRAGMASRPITATPTPSRPGSWPPWCSTWSWPSCSMARCSWRWARRAAS